MNVWEQIELFSMLLPILAMIFVFHYIPISGVLIAFQKWFPGAPYLDFWGGVEWVGLKHFRDFISGPYFPRLIRNTLVLSAMNLCFSFWIPVLFALLLNELRSPRYKKLIQTASYLPYFISSVVVAGMVLSFIQSDGIVNTLMGHWGMPPIAFDVEPRYFPFIYTITNTWRNFGWGSILYLSAMSAIDPNLYEAARLDGASRLRQTWHITLTAIRPTIVVLMIFAVGGMLNADSEMILLLYNPATRSTADVIGTYLYRDGLLGGKFSYGSAVGLTISLINFALMFGANAVARRTADYSLW